MKHFSRPSSAPPLSCIEPTASADSRTAVLSARAHGAMAAALGGTAVLSARAHGAMAAALGHEGHGDRPTATNTELARTGAKQGKKLHRRYTATPRTSSMTKQGRDPAMAARRR